MQAASARPLGPSASELNGLRNRSIRNPTDSSIAAVHSSIRSRTAVATTSSRARACRAGARTLCGGKAASAYVDSAVEAYNAIAADYQMKPIHHIRPIPRVVKAERIAVRDHPRRRPVWFDNQRLDLMPSVHGQCGAADGDLSGRQRHRVAARCRCDLGLLWTDRLGGRDQHRLGPGRERRSQECEQGESTGAEKTAGCE